MKLSKNRFAVCLTLLLVLCLSLGVSVSLGGQNEAAQAESEQTISLSGVQMRGYINGWYYYLVLQSDFYDGMASGENTAEKDALTADKIKLYTSENDVGTALSALNIQHIDQNYNGWTNGLFINYSMYDSTHGGHQVYKVVIEEGCVLPYKTADGTTGTCTVDKTYTFYNGSYGDESAKLGAMNWTGEATKTVSLDGVQLRGLAEYPDNSWYHYFVLNSSAFDGMSANEDHVEITTFASTFDKISLYTVADGNLKESKLSELKVNHSERNKWSTQGLFFAFDEYKNGYDGSSVYKVAVQQGCKIVADKSGAIPTIFVVDKDYTFYNSAFGNADSKFDALKWTTTPTLAYGADEQTISLDGIQLRGIEGNAWYQYLVLLSSAYNDLSEVENITSSKTFCDFSGIKLYTVADGQLAEKNFSEFTTNYVGRNKWGAKGGYLQFNEYANGYDGSSVYKVTIAAGTKIVAEAGEKAKVFVVDKDYTFYNSAFGNSDSKFGALNWTTTPTIGYRTEEKVENISVGMWGNDPTGRVHFRTNGAEKYFVILSEAFGGAEVTPLETSNFRTTLDKIKFYTLGNDGNLVESKLSDQGVTSVGRGHWSTSGAFFTFDNIDNFMGHKTYKVVLDEGLEILGKDELEGEIRVKTVYKTTQAYTFYNSIWDANNTEIKESTNWTTTPTIAYKTSEEDISLNGIQLRGIPGDNSWYHYLVLQSDSFEKASEMLNSGLSVSDLSKVILYVLDENGQLTGKSLSELGVSHIETNKWGEKGAFVAFDQFKNDYDGSKVYKVTIAAGTKIAYTADEEAVVFVVDKDYTFYNGSFGNAANSYNALTSTKVPTIAYKTTEEKISLEGIQLRGLAEYPDNSWYHYLVLQSDSFDTASEMLNSGLSASDFSKIMFYVFDGNGSLTSKSLAELGVNHIEINKWSAKGAFVAFDGFKNGYDGSKVYKITIAAGTKVAHIADEEAVVFVLDKDYTFYNMSYANDDNKFAAFDWVAEEPEEQTISLSGIQIRAMSEKDIWYQYLVLQSSAFNGGLLESTIKSGVRFDKIRLYLGKDDEDGITLQQLGVTHVDRNMWGANGAFINYGNYATYNGATVYKVVVEAGCVIPLYTQKADGLSTVTLYVVDKDYVFYNVNYGNEENKLGAFEWWNTPVPETVSNSGEIEVVKVSNQSDGVSRWLILWFNEKFVGTTNVSFYETKGFANVLDNIYLYSGSDLSQTPIKLRDIFTGTITVGQFGSPDAIGFTVKNDENINGSNNYLVVVKKGCEIPFIKDGVYSKRTVSNDTTFVNNDFGKTGEIPGSTGSDSRLYQNFAIDWSKAVFVTYKVEGIENVSFDKQCLVVGTQFDTSKFAKDGYEVKVADNLGYTYYGVFYAPSADVEVTLTYSEVKQPQPADNNKGCNGVVAAGGAVSMIATLFATAIVFRRKQK